MEEDRAGDDWRACAELHQLGSCARQAGSAGSSRASGPPPHKPQPPTCCRPQPGDGDWTLPDGSLCPAGTPPPAPHPALTPASYPNQARPAASSGSCPCLDLDCCVASSRPDAGCMGATAWLNLPAVGASDRCRCTPACGERRPSASSARRPASTHSTSSRCGGWWVGMFAGPCRLVGRQPRAALLPCCSMAD